MEHPAINRLQREIAFTLDWLKALKKAQKSHNRSLLDSECAIKTELLGIDARTPTYSPMRYPEEEKFKRRLFSLEQEKRRAIERHAEQRGKLDERLFSLLLKRDALTVHDGSKKTGRKTRTDHS